MTGQATRTVDALIAEDQTVACTRGANSADDTRQSLDDEVESRRWLTVEQRVEGAGMCCTAGCIDILLRLQCTVDPRSLDGVIEFLGNFADLHNHRVKADWWPNSRRMHGLEQKSMQKQPGLRGKTDEGHKERQMSSVHRS